MTSQFRPLALRFVARTFGRGESAENNQICPGEANCEIFQSARGANARAKEKNACFGCEKFPTKIDGGANLKRFDNLLQMANAARRRRDADKNFNLQNVSSSVFAGVLILDALTDEFERGLRVEQNKYLEILLKK